VSATSNMSNVKPIHFLENIVVILYTGRYGPCLDLFYCQQQRSDTCIALKKFREERACGSEIWCSWWPFLNVICRGTVNKIYAVYCSCYTICNRYARRWRSFRKTCQRFFLRILRHLMADILRTALKYCQSSTRFSLTGQGELLYLTDPATLHKTVPAKNILLPCWVLPICRNCLSAFTAHPLIFFRTTFCDFD